MMHINILSLSKINRILALGMLLIFLFCANKVNAQAPGATCLAAVAIGGTGTVPGCTGAVSMIDFTAEATSPVISCLGAGFFRREGWYSFNAPGGVAITVQATATTGTSNLIIQVISGTCALETQVACINNTTVNGASTESGNVGVLAAGTYFIRVINAGTAANMAMTNVCVNFTPTNDDCANATVLTPLGATLGCGGVAGTSVGGTAQTTIPATCTAVNTTNDDVWFTFTTTATSHVITVTPTATMDAAFQVYSTNPCGGAGTSVNCVNVNGAGTAETFTYTGLTVATQYWVRVFDIGTGIPASGTFTICIQTPPINDDCANAIVLTPNAACVTTTGDVNVSSNSGIAVSGSCPTSNPDDDVWYTFTATGTSHTVTVTGSGSFDPGFEVFTGPCGALTSVLCNAPGGVPGTTITSIVPTSVGVQYWVRVYDYGTGYPATTSFTICILNPPPPNDGCAGAIALTPITVGCVASSNQATGDVSGATQTLVGCTGNANDDVWYTFTTTATALQPYLITVVGSANFDPVFQVFGTSCGGTSLACINATGTGGTETTTLSVGGTLAASTQYWVRVYDAAAAYPTTTTFTICVRIPPINDNCGGIAIPVSGTAAAPAYCGATTAGTLSGATASGFAATCGGTPSDDVWYTFQATATSHIITVVPCAGSDIVIQGYKNSCGTGISLGCANVNGVGGTENLTVSGLVVGVFYWVRVYDFTGTSACNTFTICVSTPPVNDPCTSPTTLTPATTCVTTNGTLAGSTQSIAACAGTNNGDVWYTFNAGSTSQTITVVGSAGLNVVYQLFSTTPCGGVGTSLGCVNSTANGGTETQTFAGLTGGAQYWVMVSDFSGAPTTYTFTICVVTPQNNTCANAISVVCGGTYVGNSNIGIANAPATCTSNGLIGPGVWYVFAGNGNNVIVSLCGSSYDTQIYVFSSTGPCTGLACVAGDDDSGTICGLQSYTTFGSTVGVNYYLYVSGFSGSTGAYTMNISCVSPPVNDQCPGALPINCGTYLNTTTITFTGSTLQASSNNDLTNCGTASGTNAQSPTALWYAFQGDGENLTISTCGGTTNFNTMLGVWTNSNNDCTGTWTCVAGNDNFGAGCNTSGGNFGAGAYASSVTFTANFLTNYYVEVFGYYVPAYTGPSTGSFTLNVSAGLAGNGLTGCMPLPIELLSFTGESAGKRNLIKWTTATETNNDYFTVEKANDAVSWMTLARKNGAGNSTHAIDYSVYDDEPYPSVTYYRLKQTDFNAAYTYTAIISIMNSMNGVSLNNVHPNPTTDDISFDFSSGVKGSLQVIIMDYMGRVVSDETQNVSDGTSVINSKMGTLSKGVYSLKVVFGQTGYVSVTKVVKN